MSYSDYIRPTTFRTGIEYNGRYVQFIKLPGDALADEQPGGVWRGEVLVE